jgi:hypothetical protein
MNFYIDKIAKKFHSGIGASRKLKPCVDRNTLFCAYNALVLPHLDYCCEVWDTNVPHFLIVSRNYKI